MNFRFKINESYDDEDYDYGEMQQMMFDDDHNMSEFDPWNYIDERQATEIVIEKVGKETLINKFRDELEEIPEWGDDDYDQDDILEDVVYDHIYEFEDALQDEIDNARSEYINDVEDSRYASGDYERRTI